MRKLVLLTLFTLMSGCANGIGDIGSVLAETNRVLAGTGQFKPVTSPAPANLEGVWHGAGYQFNNNSSWTIKLTIIANKYSIDYPSLGCGGDLRLISVNDNEMQFSEHITYGKNICAHHGRTVITKTGDNSAKFTWYYANGTKGSSGTLKR